MCMPVFRYICAFPFCLHRKLGLPKNVILNICVDTNRMEFYTCWIETEESNQSRRDFKHAKTRLIL